jgi:signal recognition particle subunit SRP54
MMAGLQGSGKTTTCGKLARFMLAQGKHPVLVACDLQRPAAVDQLAIVAEQVGVPVFRMEGQTDPVKVAGAGVNWASANACDVVIIDTAGRLHVDEEMMKQAEAIAQATQPHQIYLVCDAMTGQDAVNSAREFNERLELDGVILTKFDSDARGGAALSIKAVTGKPIKFIGVGEKLDRLEEFHPDRMAERILGMDDFLGQMKQMKKLGPMKEVLKLMPGMSSQLQNVQMDEGEMEHMEAIIHSMTPAERAAPQVVDASRRRRIARGSGTDPQEVSGLIKSFDQAANMMKQMAGMGMKDRMAFAKQLGQMDMFGGMRKVKHRSHRLSKKERLQKKKKRRR